MTIMLSLISIIEVLLITIPVLLIVAFAVGYYGLLQAFADALKLLLKEYVSPTQWNIILSVFININNNTIRSNSTIKPVISNTIKSSTTLTTVIPVATAAAAGAGFISIYSLLATCFGGSILLAYTIGLQWKIVRTLDTDGAKSCAAENPDMVKPPLLEEYKPIEIIFDIEPTIFIWDYLKSIFIQFTQHLYDLLLLIDGFVQYLLLLINDFAHNSSVLLNSHNFNILIEKWPINPVYFFVYSVFVAVSSIGIINLFETIISLIKRLCNVFLEIYRKMVFELLHRAANQGADSHFTGYFLSAFILFVLGLVLLCYFFYIIIKAIIKFYIDAREAIRTFYGDIREGMRTVYPDFLSAIRQVSSWINTLVNSIALNLNIASWFNTWYNSVVVPIQQGLFGGPRLYMWAILGVALALLCSILTGSFSFWPSPFSG